MATIKGITVQIGAETTGLKAALKDVENESSKLRSELKEIERQLKFDPHNVELWAQKQKVLNDQVEATREKLNRLKDVQAQVNQQFQEGKISEEQYRAFQREIAKTESQLKDYEKQLKQVNLQNHEFNQRMQEMGKKLQDVGKQMTDVGKKLSARVTAPLTAFGAVAAKSAIDFESAFAGVRKTVNASEAEFAALERGIRDMAKEIPASAAEIAKVAEAAGQLGIANEHILSFTRTMIDLGVATDMSADEAAMSLARLANITQMPQSEFDRLGATVVALGNNLAATEREIVDMGLRLAGAGSQVGMTEAEILSLAAALSSVGIAAEAGGSAFSKVMVQMQLAAETGGKNLENFAAVAGMSAEEFQKAFRENAAGALLAFIEGLSSAEEQGISAIKVLDDMGIAEVRMRDALLRAAGAEELFSDALKIGTEAWDENTALTKEAEERYKTVAAQLKTLRNNLTDVAIQFGEVLLPLLLEVVEKVKGFADRLSNLDDRTKKMIVVVGGLAAALGPISVILGKTVTGASSLLKGFNALATFITKTLVPAIMKINWPAVGVVAAIAGIIAIGYEMYRAWNEIKDAVSATWELIRAAAERLGLSIALAFEEMKHSVIAAVNEILNRLSVLENFPFGLGEKFAGLKDQVSEGVDESTKKIEELRTKLEENFDRVSEALDNTKVAFSDLGAKVAEDVQSAIDAVTGKAAVVKAAELEQTEIIIEEQQKQTNVTEKENKKRTIITKDNEQEQTDIVDEEAEKRKQLRTKFEQDWNEKLFQLTADRLEQLEAEYKATIDLAKELGADTTAVEAYYQLRREQIEKDAREKRLAFQQDWNQKLLELTTEGVQARLAALDNEEQKALAKAKELEADVTAIKDYYEKKRQKIEQEAQREREDILKAWQDKLFELTATEEELLRKRAQDRIEALRQQAAEAIALMEGNAEATATIEQTLALEIEQINKELNDTLKAQEKAKQEERENLLKAWRDRLFEVTATEEELLRKRAQDEIDALKQRMAEEIKLAEGNAEAILDIERYTALEIKRINDELQTALDELEKKRRERREAFEAEWQRRYYEAIGDRRALFELDLAQLEKEKEQAKAEAEKLGVDVNQILEYYAKRQADLAEKLADDQKSAWEKAFEAVESPLERFVSAVSDAAVSLVGVVQAIRSGNWADAFLSIIMETESFARAMELIGAVLGPVITLFDAILRPVIEFLIGLWNGIIDALASISIFGWKPFAGLKDKRIGLVGESDKGGDDDKGRGGRQVSEITGPTRDLFVDLLAPLANLSQIVAPLQDIRNILDARLPNFDNLALAGVGGNINITVAPGAVVVQGGAGGKIDMDDLSKKLAKQLAGEIRGRGGR